LLFLLLFTTTVTFAQSQLEILHSDIFEINEKNKIKKLIGNVKIKHKETTFTCDSAYLTKKDNIIEGFGNIKINDKNNFLKSKYLIYDKKKQIAQTSGDVIFSNKKATIHSEKLYYNLKSKQINYNKRSKIKNENTTIYSNLGKYDIKNKTMYLKGEVELTSNDIKFKSDTLIHYPNTSKTLFIGPTNIYNRDNFIYCEKGTYNESTQKYNLYKNTYIKNEEYYIKGEKIFYNKIKSYSYVTGNSIFVDSVNNIEILSDTINYFEHKKKGVFKNNILLKMVNNKDTLFLRSDSMYIQNNTLTAKQNIKFFSREIQGKSEIMNYKTKTEEITLEKKPIIWSSNYQIKGEKIQIQIKNNKIENLSVTENPFFSEKKENEFFNQIKGDKINMIFKENKVKKISFEKSVTSIYLVEEKDKIKGFNKTKSQNMEIVFKKNKVSNIKSFGQIESQFTPIEKQETENSAKLIDFSWDEHERPISIKDIF